MDLQELIRKNILMMEPYSSARDEYKDSQRDMVYLDANENPTNNEVNRYPDPQQKQLKHVLSKIKNVRHDTILLGNGSDEVLDLIIRAFCEPKDDNIITLPPTYGMYGVLSALNAIENREVVLLPNFQPDFDSILKAIDTNTKLIFLCSPNNPTGNSFPDDIIESLLKIFKGIIVLDEAYIDFSERESWLSRIENYPNLVIVQTLSKAYGLAGIRLGILYGSVDIIRVLNKIKPPYNINQLTQVRALKELSDLPRINSIVQLIINERVRLVNEFESIKFIKAIYPSDANFILVEVDNAEIRYKQLLENGIVVRNRSSQPLCNNCLRISVGTEEENQKLIKILRSL